MIIQLMSITIILGILIAPSAYAFSLDGITTPAGLFASEVVYRVKQVFNGVQSWVFLYMFSNRHHHDYLLKENDKMRAYHELFYQETINPECCKPSDCIIEPSTVCVEMCQDCEQVRQELDVYYNE